MTYSRCPLTPVVTGRTVQDVVWFRFMRHWLRCNWRLASTVADKELKDAVVKGTGYYRIMLDIQDHRK